MQSTTLENIDTWSSIQSGQTARSTLSLQSCGSGIDIYNLAKDYGGLSMAQSYKLLDDPADRDDLSRNSHGDVDCTELDEAILRVRSTTVSNIFDMSNPMYHFSAVTNVDSSCAHGPISPTSISSYSMLSRNGSMSMLVANTNGNGSSNHATSSPLSLPLIANPIHQTTSLDNYFGIPMDRQRQRDPIGGALGMPARRFSEYTLEAGPSLAFASHPLGQKYASDTANCNAGSNDARVSGMLRKSSDRLALAPPVSAVALAIAGDDVDDAGGGGSSINSAFQPIKAQNANVFGSWRDSFDHQLSVMREEDGLSANIPGPDTALDNSVLMRTMSFASGAPKSATQLSNSHYAAAHGSEGKGSLFSVNGALSASPVNGIRQSSADHLTGAATDASYFPLRVQSLKDLRCPSTDPRSDRACGPNGVDEQAVNAAFERSASVQNSAAFSHFSRVSEIHRRHSLNSAGLFMPTPENSQGTAQQTQANFAVHPAQQDVWPSSGLNYLGGSCGSQPAYVPFTHPGSGGVPYGMGLGPAPPVTLTQQQQPFYQYNGPHHGGFYNGYLIGAVPQPMLSAPPAHIHAQAQHPPAFVPMPLLAPTQHQNQNQQQGPTMRPSYPGPPVSASGAYAGVHTLMPNPATNITPNMPFAHMGMGIAYHMLPKGTRVFVVQFKGDHHDLHFAPGPKATDPKEAAAESYRIGTYVMVEADRGVDLGYISSELHTPEAIFEVYRALVKSGAHSGNGGKSKPMASDSKPPASSRNRVHVKRIFRVANQSEIADMKGKKAAEEQKALDDCHELVKDLGLEMVVHSAEFQFDRRKLTFTFTSPLKRVLFQDLIHELFKIHKTRLWMYHKKQSKDVGARFMSTVGATQRTALYDLHKKNGAKFAPFAGWDMPLMYADQGALDSHLHTRKHASIFDVSHMLQTRIIGKDRNRFLEHLVVADLQELPVGGSTLSLFTNEKGGIEDDTIITQHKDSLYVVSNAGCADKDLAHMLKHAKLFQDKGGDVEVRKIEDHSLIALQGPSSQRALEQVSGANLSQMPFMTGQFIDIKGVQCHIARSGYTGEDGFELSIPTGEVVAVTEALMANPEVKLAGLAARDSLRLEAGLCLYGSDIDSTTTPMEANLVWTIGKRRRAEGGFIGADIILDQIAKKGGDRRRVGLIVEGAPARAHSKVLSVDGEEIGEITSGVPSPSLGKNIAMAYVRKGFNKKDTELKVKVRNRIQDAKVVKMPFVPAGYYKL
ncbi:hypothetical protein LPJ66_007071 [Kickxella alabastrina]|uniref:Uncharacterized protein n=1 Tax=Kickxella alabastrina TaxID=61397 RepID=A0ACC1IDV8_9FUNG|nr:hypothetical protein LPJ66_007071 [Kickxella alabastrina]